MIRKLRRKFLLAAVAAVFLVLLVLIGAINLLNYRSLVAEADRTLAILSSNRGVFPSQMLRREDPPAESGPPDAPADPPDGLFGGRRNGFGELAFQSRYFSVSFGEDGARGAVNLENLVSLTEEEASAMAEAVYVSGRTWGFTDEYRFCRSSPDGETLLLFLNCQRELETFRSFLTASLWISLGGLLAVFLLLLLFSGRIVRPIAESYEKQKRFITDAGHELKTPITIIQADADVLESEAEEGNEWLSDIRKQTRRLTELTADLIYLSKMEEENVVLPKQDFSLSELTEETARSFQSLAYAGKKDFTASVAPDLVMKGDEKAVAKLVSILLDNAMKYSPEGGTVSLTLERSGRNARLTVRNSTPPMERGRADRLFERFTRADASRHSGSGGFGLGLAIAKAVTEAHRGKIRAESEDGLSLTVTAEIPLA